MLVYGTVAGAAVWSGAVPAMLARAAMGRLVPGEWRERLGRAAPPAGSPRPILIHGVSAGEVTAARALVDALVRRNPGVRIVLTTGTRDGRTLADRCRADVPQVAAVQFLPWDRPRAMRRWLTHLNPAAVAVIETELWPGLFSACRTLAIPLFVVSARLYPRDVRRYQWLGRWWSDVMAMPTRVLAQDAAEAEAFVAIGTPCERVEVGGNLKFDAARQADGRRAGETLAVVAGSTHPPEDAWILGAVARLQRNGLPCIVTLAPRDVRRAASIRRQARVLGVTNVTVLDRMGQLQDAYGAAHVAICGGTFTPKGGHNFIEPAAAGCAIVAGPHVAHVRGLADQLEAAGGVVRLPATADPAATIADALIHLHRDRRRLEDLSARARAWCAGRRGAADRAAGLILADTPDSGLTPGEAPSSRCS